MDPTVGPSDEASTLPKIKSGSDPGYLMSRLTPCDERDKSAKKRDKLSTRGYFNDLPLDVLNNICGQLPQPADAVMLAATCKDLRSKINGQNLLWYQFFDHNDKQKQELEKYKNLSDDNFYKLYMITSTLLIDCFLDVPDLNCREFKERFFSVHLESYDASVNYRERATTILTNSGLNMGPEARCQVCVRPNSLVPDGLTFMFFFNKPGRGGKVENSKRLCKECACITLVGYPGETFLGADISQLARANPPRDAWFRDQYGKPLDKAQLEEGYPEVCPNSIYGRFFSMQERDKLCLLSDVDKIVQKHRGHALKHHRAINIQQGKAYKMLFREVVLKVRQKFPEVPRTVRVKMKRGTKRVDLNYMFSEDQVKSYLEHEWRKFKLRWDYLDEVDELSHETVTIESHYLIIPKSSHRDGIDSYSSGGCILDPYSSIFDVIDSPPLDTENEAETQKWLFESSATISDNFFIEPSLPLLPNIKSKLNYLQFLIWESSKHEFTHGQSNKAGRCKFCADDEYYTPYYYAIHMYLEHRGHFDNKSTYWWQWRSNDEHKGTQWNTMTKSVLIHKPITHLCDSYIARLIKTKQYGPRCIRERGDSSMNAEWWCQYYLEA